jgi:hypothetical protein
LEIAASVLGSLKMCHNSVEFSKEVINKSNIYQYESYTVNSEHILCLKVSNYPLLIFNDKSYDIEWIENNKFHYKSFQLSDKINATITTYKN